MDHRTQTVTARPEGWSAEALALLERVEEHDTSGGMERVRDYQRDNFPLIAIRDAAGELLGAYAVAWVPQYRNLHILAAASAQPHLDMTAVMLTDMEARARRLEADYLSLQTRRAGLVKKLSRAGFDTHGVILRKLMKAVQ